MGDERADLYGSPEGTCTHFILIRSLELLIRGNELVIRGNGLGGN